MEQTLFIVFAAVIVFALLYLEETDRKQDGLRLKRPY